ncbi:MAG TPA: hypothetical protein DDZ96_11805 [Porphyromonadaceae bacterium]|nr:hypothetical protein [Porphyromonadaceae bacterium]HBK31561.1 hypothetical protein [Porphyromonadaceae bacterium]HBL34483.1 hypothetical protein [Porphyromonadaceae bacterium]HBX21159.1 hypothetical protein [Porphyromonadaceae bacterium]HCM20873.1 hypothetical protein [Porphyromonadaceae bacterium]
MQLNKFMEDIIKEKVEKAIKIKLDQLQNDGKLVVKKGSEVLKVESLYEITVLGVKQLSDPKNIWEFNGICRISISNQPESHSSTDKLWHFNGEADIELTMIKSEVHVNKIEIVDNQIFVVQHPYMK